MYKRLYKIVVSPRLPEGMDGGGTAKTLARGLTEKAAKTMLLQLWRQVRTNAGLAGLYPTNETNWGKIIKGTEDSAISYAYTRGGLRGFFFEYYRYQIEADTDVADSGTDGADLFRNTEAAEAASKTK